MHSPKDLGGNLWSFVLLTKRLHGVQMVVSCRVRIIKMYQILQLPKKTRNYKEHTLLFRRVLFFLFYLFICWISCRFSRFISTRTSRFCRSWIRGICSSVRFRYRILIGLIIIKRKWIKKFISILLDSNQYNMFRKHILLPIKLKILNSNLNK